MLTKKDLEQIEAITTKVATDAATKAINIALMDFWDQLVKPSFTKLAEESNAKHEQLREEIASIHTHLGDHDTRIRKLEVFSGIR